MNIVVYLLTMIAVILYGFSSGRRGIPYGKFLLFESFLSAIFILVQVVIL